MSTATQPVFAKDSWQTPRNARTLRAYMALQNQEIAARIRELRARRPQTVVADAIGVAERTYQNWEAGDAKPNYRSLQKLAEYYGIGEEYILAGTGTPPEPTAPDPFAASDGSQLDRIEQLLQTGVDRLEQIGEERRRQQEEMLGRIEALEHALIQQAEAQTTKAIAAAVKRIAAEYAARQAPAAGPEEAAPVAQGSSRRRSRQA